MALLEDRVAIITGSGRGIGAAAARAFAAEGARVVISDLDPSPAEETLTAIRSGGGTCIMHNGDLTDGEFPADLVEAAVEAFGGLDIIVNNAGYPWDSLLESMSEEQWFTMLDVHLTAPYRLLRAASKYLLAAAKKERATQGHSQARKIVNVSSVAGLYGNAGQVNYAAAKAGIVGLTKTLAQEWGPYNVQVNCVCYGFIDTRLTAPREQGGEGIEHQGAAIALGIPQRMRQKVPLRVALERMGTPEEAAGPMLFLASPLSNYVSGGILEVAGGFVP